MPTDAEREIHALNILLIDMQGAHMRVLLDNGPYRHVRFERDDTGLYWVDLITAPHLLTVSSGHGAFVFGGQQDPIDSHTPEPTLQLRADYWKLWCRSRGEDQLTSYDEELFLDAARGLVDDLRKAIEAGAVGLPDPQELLDDLTERFDDSEFTEEQWARDYLRNWESLGVGSETYLLNLHTWDYAYLRALWAMKWALAQYRRQPIIQHPQGRVIPLVPIREAAPAR